MSIALFLLFMSFSSCFFPVVEDVSTEFVFFIIPIFRQSIKASLCPEWLRYFDDKVLFFYGIQPRVYHLLLILHYFEICLVVFYTIRSRYSESVDFNFHFTDILTVDVIKLHIREIMYVAGDSSCRNRVDE